MTDFVLDNSVVTRWFVDSAVHPYADSVLGRVAGGDRAVVPALWRCPESQFPVRHCERSEAIQGPQLLPCGLLAPRMLWPLDCFVARAPNKKRTAIALILLDNLCTEKENDVVDL